MGAGSAKAAGASAAMLLAIAIAAGSLHAQGEPPELVLTPRNRIARTLRLLATSTPQRRNRVKILFYGQSMTEGPWADRLKARLRERYPEADLTIENRALGGFAAQELVSDAETDLYPVYPDLVILHAFGAHDRYEDLIRHLRERTTAEIVMQTDPVLRDEELSEETRPEKLSPDPAHWAPFMNYRWLPELAKRYDTLLCDLRGVFKRFLSGPERAPINNEYGGHLNALGNTLVYQATRECLRYDPSTPASPADSWVRTLEAGKDFVVQNGKLRVELEGNRIDAIGWRATRRESTVRIDAKAPSELPELYTFTRALSERSGKWPLLSGLSSQALPLVETFTLTLTKQSSDGVELYSFALEGSRSGSDGTGRSDQRFVSDSRRVVIDPEDFKVAYALELAHVDPVPEQLTVRFGVERHCVDALRFAPRVRPGSEISVTLAQGLANGPHVLELEGPELDALRALRVYRPPLKAALPPPPLSP